MAASFPSEQQQAAPGALENDKKMELWSKRALSEYNRICDNQRHARCDSIKTTFADNRTGLTMKLASYRPKKMREIKHVGHGGYVKSVKMGRISFRNILDRQETPLRVLPHVEGLPAMFSWVSVKKNCYIDDETELRNIPYVEDEQRDDSFLEEFVRNYDGRVHSDDKFPPDEHILVELLESLTAQFYAEEPMDSSRTLAHHIPTSVIEGLLLAFNQPITAESISDVDKSYLQAKGMSSTPLLPSLDGPVTVSATRDQALHTHRSLFCRRCYKYDCPQHPFKVPPGTFKYKKPDLSAPENMCSPNCYIVQTHSRRTNRGIAEESAWTSAEETMFRVFRPLWPSNMCKIAQILGTKTCLQVQQFAEKEACLSPSTFQAAQSPPRNTTNTKKRQQQRQLWTMHQRRQDLGDKSGSDSNVHNYRPCYHPGEDCNAQCICMINSTCCEKFCLCGSSCKNRFPGCRCRGQCSTKQCPCYMAVRECDPDLCTQCGSNNYSPNATTPVCKNVAIQRGLHKHLLQAPSDVAGWGIFLKDAAEKNDFISEYCGEMISQEEADRRGKLYDRYMCSFLFNLNSEYVVDATRKGNKIRFANHSVNANCYAKVLLVNGEHRIGIYAKQAIQSGEELFFDYRYGPMEQLKFVGKERKVNI